MNLSMKHIVIVIGSFLIAAFGYAAYQIFKPLYVDREIARDIEITREWTEIIPPSPMKIKRNFQSVGLELNGAAVLMETNELRLPNGKIIEPILQIQGSDGNWYDLETSSYTTSRTDIENDLVYVNLATFRVESDQKEYLKVRIRSNEPFTCSKVIWRNYDLK